MLVTSLSSDGVRWLSHCVTCSLQVCLLQPCMLPTTLSQPCDSFKTVCHTVVTMLHIVMTFWLLCKVLGCDFIYTVCTDCVLGKYIHVYRHVTCFTRQEVTVFCDN